MVIANGIISTGIGSGLMLGALISNTVLSPLLGGWRHVLMFYGGIGVLLGMIWAMTKSVPSGPTESADHMMLSFKAGLMRLVRVKTVWLLAFGQLCYSGSLMGYLGYVALYLRGAGWGVGADGALAVSSAAGVVFAIPIALLSRRLGSRVISKNPAI